MLVPEYRCCCDQRRKKQTGGQMSHISMKSLLEAGVHFGHQTKRWNPKMSKYVFGKRNGIYIIDLQKLFSVLIRPTSLQGI